MEAIREGMKELDEGKGAHRGIVWVVFRALAACK
jgi:hypothetical protein